MTFTKSLMLGSAAALVAVAGASAADLPSKKAAPAQYVKICDAAGAGYFYIPGSDTCLKISGYAELQIKAGNIGNQYSVDPGLAAPNGGIPGVTTSKASRNSHTFSLDNEIVLEAKTKTSYGDLYTKVAYEGDVGVNSLEIDRAYVQWAGLTAGRYTTFMNFGMGGLYHGFGTNDYGTNLLAYTASFGGGFSATLSIEDSTISRQGVGLDLVAAAAPATNYNLANNGARTPDVVGQLSVAQGWGSFGIAAGYHNSTYVNGLGLNASKSGFGITSGATVKFGPNDTLSLFAGYERNALKFIGGGFLANNGWQASTVDFVEGHNQTGWALTGQYGHNWTPSVSTTLEATYQAVRYDGATFLHNTATNNYNTLAIGQVTKWSPVAGLTFGLDTTYVRTSNKWNVMQATIDPAVKRSSSEFTAQFRVNRSF